MYVFAFYPPLKNTYLSRLFFHKHQHSVYVNIVIKDKKGRKQSPPPTAHFFIERQFQWIPRNSRFFTPSPNNNNSRQCFILFSFYGAVIKYARRRSSWCIWNTIRSSWKWGLSCNKVYIGGHCSLFYHPHTLSAGHVKVLANCCCEFCWRPIKTLATKEVQELILLQRTIN